MPIWRERLGRQRPQRRYIVPDDSDDEQPTMADLLAALDLHSLEVLLDAVLTEVSLRAGTMPGGVDWLGDPAN
jgi:type II secretory pathway component GspD/PulD (secretin)